MTNQPPLMDITGSTLPGPQFKARPGWGGQLYAWLTHHAYSIVMRILILAIIFIVGRSLYLLPNASTQPLASTTPISNADAHITLNAQPREGMTHLAEHALSIYAETQTTPSLDAAQHLFAIDALARRTCWCALTPGQAVSFSIETLENVVRDARALTPAQYRAWSALVRSQ